jgi:hypothetical protein
MQQQKALREIVAPFLFFPALSCAFVPVFTSAQHSRYIPFVDDRKLPELIVEL